MVQAVRRGKSMRAVAREFHVSLHTVQRWVARASTQRPNRVQWSDRPSGAPEPFNRTSLATEAIVLRVREDLSASDLGDAGSDAIRACMLAGGRAHIPSVRTIGRILQRRGVLDGRRRIRRPPPPIGWYLPEVAVGSAEVDSFDTIEGLVLRGGIEIQVLNGISVQGALTSCWPRLSINAASVVELLMSRWRDFGLPTYAQFDNATIFQGPHQHADVIGRVIRACLLLDIKPVFAPPREPGFQNAVESLNGRWQSKVWRRFQHASLEDLQQRSDRWVAAVGVRNAARIERAPARRSFPADLDLNLGAHPRGVVIFIRRTDDHGFASLLGRRFFIDDLWTHRLVRAEVDLERSHIRFFALRRRDPADQPLLALANYSLPTRRFRLRS
jgi:transposase-like protein